MSVKPKGFVCLSFFSLRSMSVTQAMEWLIEHVDDPSVDAPIPGQDSSGAAGATAAAAAAPSTSVSGSTLLRGLSGQSSTDESSRQDELTEIFKRIRRKREFRPDSRVSSLVDSKTSRGLYLPQTCLLDTPPVVTLLTNQCFIWSQTLWNF